jgi:hypothetical protein
MVLLLEAFTNVLFLELCKCSLWLSLNHAVVIVGWKFAHRVVSGIAVVEKPICSVPFLGHSCCIFFFFGRLCRNSLQKCWFIGCSCGEKFVINNSMRVRKKYQCELHTGTSLSGPLQVWRWRLPQLRRLALVFYYLEGSLKSFFFYEGAEIREGTAHSNTSQGITSQ